MTYPSFFLSRLILLKVPDQKSASEVEIELSLLDLFPQYDDLANLSDHLKGKMLTLSDRPAELISDLVSHLSGIKIDAVGREESAIEYYNAHL